MKIGEFGTITPAKVAALQERIRRLKIDVGQIKENFITGGGKGGQKINKTANAVVLTYPMLNLTVKVQRERQRSLNRFLALRELVDQIELKISPQTSERIKKWRKIRKQKKRIKRRRNNP